MLPPQEPSIINHTLIKVMLPKTFMLLLCKKKFILCSLEPSLSRKSGLLPFRKSNSLSFRKSADFCWHPNSYSIETYNSINMKGRTYEFKYHFRNLLDEKMKVACTYCWSYNHQTNSHQGNVHRYDHPDKVYTHLPVIDDQYWCPYGCESYAMASAVYLLS